jgi:GNAT superfamily N-acetyltransferase
VRQDAALGLPDGCILRPRTPADQNFLAALYAETREEELRPALWTEEQKRAFLRDQFHKQHAHYLAHYPAAEWWVIVSNGEPVGRIYLEQTEAELRLMDIALSGTHRGQGLGARLIDAVLRRADEAGVPVRLHVEPFNPALRLYTRRGFHHCETRGVYWFMERPVGAASVEDQLIAQPVSTAADGHHEQIQATQPGM